MMEAIQMIQLIMGVLIIYQTCAEYQRSLELPAVMLGTNPAGQSTGITNYVETQVKLIEIDVIDSCKSCNNTNCTDAVVNRQAFKIHHNESFVVPFASEESRAYTRISG